MKPTGDVSGIRLYNDLPIQSEIRTASWLNWANWSAGKSAGCCFEIRQYPNIAALGLAESEIELRWVETGTMEIRS